MGDKERIETDVLDEEKDLGTDVPANKKKKPEKKKLKPGSGGCVGCFAGIIATFIFTILTVVFGGFFLLDRFLIVNYNMTVNDCFTLMSSLETVNEKKVITEGKATEEDRDEFYSTIADSLFLKDDTISSLIDTAVDEFVVPMVNDAISSAEQGVTASPVRFGNGEDGSFDWQAFLKELLDEGIVDKEKIEAYFNNQASAEEKYAQYFVLDIKGKGMVSTADYVLNRVLLSNPDTKKLAHTFGISQLKFSSGEENGESFKQINVVLDVKVKNALTNFINSPLFDKFITDQSIRDNKAFIKQIVDYLPARILLSVDLNIKDTVTVNFRINNISDKQLDKWLGFIKQIMGVDVKGLLNDSADSYYKEIRKSLIKYADIEKMIGNGKLDVDMFEIVSVVLNEQMGLEGENALSKVEASTTVSNVLYANMDVNGNGIESVVQKDAPTFATDDWKQEAEADFIDWLATNVAFDKNHSIDEVIAKFRDETGKFAVPSEFTSLLEFIDAEYLRNGTAFLKSGLTFDDRFIAYLFEDYKQDIFAMAGYEKLAPALSLQYVSITENEVEGVKHHYLSLGLSAKTQELCDALGYGDFGFVSSLVGEEVFLCATADITLDKKIERTPTLLKINGLSAEQTFDILKTVKKLTGYDIVKDLVDNNIDKFVDQFVIMTDNKYSLGFEIRTNADGSSTGMVILPSITEILQQVLTDSGKADIDVEAVVDAVGVFLKSSPSTDNYKSSLADTSLALTGKADAYESYDDVIADTLFAKYFLSSNSNLEEVLALVLKVINEEEGAMDELLGTEDKAGLIKINSAYFATNTTLESTCPVLDGHTLAYIINNAKGVLADLLGDETAKLIEKVEVRDINIGGGYLSVTVASTPKQLLDLEQMSSLDSFVKNFIYGIFGGENADITVTLKINVADNKEKLVIKVQDMSEEDMKSIFDMLKAFGINEFDFADENNQFVKLADQIAGYIKQYATIDGTTATLPSVFGLINKVVNNAELTEEAMYSAVRALMLSEANTSDYNDVLSDANEILTGDAQSNKSYEELVHTYAEKKYVIKDGKNIGDVLSAVGSGSDDLVGVLTDEQNGVIDLSRTALKEYFTAVAPTFDKTNPTVDGHTLAYIIDTYKSSLSDMMGMDEQTSELLGLVKVADITADDGVLTVRIVLNVKDLAEKLVSGGEFDVNMLFNVLEEGTEVLSVSLAVDLVGENSVKLAVNDMSDSEFDRINTLLKAFGITYLDMSASDNPLKDVVGTVKQLINEYMPYSESEKVFKMKSVFDFIAENVEFGGQKISADDGYTLIGSFATYDDSKVEEEDFSAVDYEGNLNALTSRYYAINNGMELVEKAQSGGITIDDIEINADVIKNGSGEYKQTFVYGKENVIPFIMGMGIDLGGEGFTLNRIDVTGTNTVSVNIIIEVSAFVGESMEVIASALPARLSVTVPISFISAEHGDWVIDGMDGFEKARQILKTIGVDLDSIVNDARNSMADGSVKQIMDDLGVAFVNEGEEGIRFPALPDLYTKIDNTFTANEVIILIDNVVCYDESNIVYGENYDDEYEGAFNALALEYYAVNNGISLIDSALNGSVDVDSISIDKAKLESGKYKNSFVYNDEYLIPFIDRMGMGIDEAGLTLNTLSVSNDNEITVNVIAETVELVGGASLGVFSSLLPEKLSVTIPISFVSGATQDEWRIDGMGEFDTVVALLKRLGMDVDSVVNTQRDGIISSVGDSFTSYGISFVAGEEAGLEMPSLIKLYGKIDDTLSERDVEVLIDDIVLNDTEVVVNDYSSSTYKSDFDELASKYYAIDNGYVTLQGVVDGTADKNSLSIDAELIRQYKNHKNFFMYPDTNLVPFVNGMGMGLDNADFILNSISVLAEDQACINVVVNTSAITGGAELGSFADLLPARLSLNIPVHFGASTQPDWEIEGVADMDGVINALKAFGIDVDGLVSDSRTDIIDKVHGSFDSYGIAFTVAQFDGEDIAGLKMPSLVELYSVMDDTLASEELALLIDEIVCYNSDNVKEKDYTASPYKADMEQSVLKHYAMKNGYSTIKSLTSSSGVDTASLSFDKAYFNAERNYTKSFVYAESNLVPFLSDLSMSPTSDGYTLNYIKVVGTNVIDTEIIVTVDDLVGGADMGAMDGLMPDRLAIVIPVDLSKTANEDHGEWRIVGVEDTASIVSVIKKLGVDIESQIKEHRASLLSGSGSVKSMLDSYGMSFVNGENAGLKMPEFTKLYGLIDSEGTLEESEITCLIDNLVRYDENANVKEESNTEYKNELNSIVQQHYAISDGYSTMSELVKGAGFSIDSLDFDVEIFRNGGRDYVNSFIYEDIYLASFIKDLEIAGTDGGFIINRIEVEGKDKIKVNLIVELGSVSGADFGVMQTLLPTRLSVTVPMSFDSDDHGAWTIDGLGEQDKVVSILKAKLATDLDSLITSQRDSFISGMSTNLKSHGMSFDVKNDKAGLLMPSVCALYAKEKEGFGEDDAVYLFDNLVCYNEKEHSIFENEADKEASKAEFMSIMKKYYHIRESYTGDAEYVNADGTTEKRENCSFDVTYDILLASFGFNISGYTGYLIDTKDLMNIDDPTILMDASAVKDLRNDVLFNNKIVTLWIESIGSVEDFKLEKIEVVGNDKISFTGFIGMSDHLGENVCQTAKSLMCENLNVTMQINLASGSLIDYYIEDLAGDVDGRFEGIGNDYEKTQKLIEIMHDLDDSLDVNNETFASYAQNIALTVNNMLSTIVGIDPYAAQEGDTTEQKAKAVYYSEGEIPAELEVFGTNSGFLLPDGASYAYKNCPDFRNLFDTYYHL